MYKTHGRYPIEKDGQKNAVEVSAVTRNQLKAVQVSMRDNIYIPVNMEHIQKGDPDPKFFNLHQL